MPGTGLARRINRFAPIPGPGFLLYVPIEQFLERICDFPTGLKEISFTKCRERTGFQYRPLQLLHIHACGIPVKHTAIKEPNCNGQTTGFFYMRKANGSASLVKDFQNDRVQGSKQEWYDVEQASPWTGFSLKTNYGVALT